MFRTSLLPCPACSRHVRTSEIECPFCAVALIGMRDRAPAPLPRPPKGASRAAVFAFQTALLAGSACTGTHRPTDHQAGGEGAVDDGLPDAAVAQAGQNAGQGAPAMDAGGFDNSTTPASPPRVPAATIEPEPDDSDGGYVPVPIYGGPFPDPRSRARV